MHESEKWKWSQSFISASSQPLDYSPPGSSVHGILQVRVLEWVAIAFSVNMLLEIQQMQYNNKHKFKV